jgi:hypothetical protein
MESEGTPLEAARLGLCFTEVDEVEEGQLSSFVASVSVADRSGKATNGRGLWAGWQETYRIMEEWQRGRTCNRRTAVWGELGGWQKSERMLPGARNPDQACRQPSPSSAACRAPPLRCDS